MRLPEYTVTIQVQVQRPYGETQYLPAYSFIQPINPKYVPEHVVEFFRMSYLPSKHIYCYCHYGIVIIEKEDVRMKE